MHILWIIYNSQSFYESFKYYDIFILLFIQELFKANNAYRTLAWGSVYVGLPL